MIEVVRKRVAAMPDRHAADLAVGTLTTSAAAAMQTRCTPCSYFLQSTSPSKIPPVCIGLARDLAAVRKNGEPGMRCLLQKDLVLPMPKPGV